VGVTSPFCARTVSEGDLEARVAASGEFTSSVALTTDGAEELTRTACSASAAPAEEAKMPQTISGKQQKRNTQSLVGKALRRGCNTLCRNVATSPLTSCHELLIVDIFMLTVVFCPVFAGRLLFNAKISQATL
jgi:hypothetical protein